MTLSETTVQTVKATVPALKEHGRQIILCFYDILFDRYPSVKSYFNMDRQRGGFSSDNGLPSQVVSLARAVLAYAEHIDNVEAILPVVENICHKHVSRGVEAPHYDAVGECLLSAIKKTLGDAATEGIMKAWAEAYAFLAETFISIEADLKERLSKTAGYQGMVDMVVSSECTNGVIGLVPIKHSVPPFTPGQFVSVAVGEHMTSVKLVEGQPDQLSILISNGTERATAALLSVEQGDVIKVSMPCGSQVTS